MKAVGFDFGQTLAEMDHAFLQRRLAELGLSFDPSAAREASTDAWQLYGQSKSAGHEAAWRAMIGVFLRRGGVPESAVDEAGAWLWQQQPARNLWRRPLPGMIELVRELKARGVRLAIISNSEGRLSELVAELGWSAYFDVIADSGRLGIDKPQPGIFQHVCAALALPSTELLHVGDSWEADVEGALGVGAGAVWFDARHRQRQLRSGVYGAGDAAELREVLARLRLVS